MPTAPKVIAIIDDDPSIMDAMDNLLSSMGYQTERMRRPRNLSTRR